MITVVLQVAVYLAVPLAALALEKRSRAVEWLSPIVVCYLVGIAMVNAPFIGVDAEAARATTEAAIPLAIPLILFPSEFRALLAQSRATITSFFCAVIAVLLSATAGTFVFASLVDDAAEISGMLVGVYTGGTPNMMGIGMALDVPEETFALLNAADVVMGGMYLLILLTIAKPLLSKLLPGFETPDEIADADPAEVSASDDNPWPKRARGMALAFGVSVFVVALSAGVTWLLVGEMAVAGIFLGLTTGGIIGSFIAPVRNLEGSYELGNYLILVFCVAMGAQTDVTQLVEAGSVLLGYTASVIGCAILLHIAMAAAFRIDVDTFIITSTAAVYGPAFVPPIAEAIDNRHVILPGLTAGLAGYAVGNYLGLLLAYALQL
ncbi:MAG: DUF819 family protein [Persicimonas sp.]